MTLINPPIVGGEGGVDTTARATANQALTATTIQDNSVGIPAEKFSGLDFSGETNSRAGLAAAIASAAGERIILPKKSALRIIADEPLRVPADGVRIEAPQGSAQIVHYEESTEGGPATWAPLFSTTDSGPLVLRGLTIAGTHRSNRTQGNVNFIAGDRSGQVIIEDCLLRDARAMMTAIFGVQGFRAVRNTLLRGRRDGFHMMDPRGYVEIMHNQFLWMRDDAVHLNYMGGTTRSGLTYPPGGQEFRIEGNVSLGSLGLLVSGGRRGSISRNFSRFGTNRFIKLGMTTEGGGDTTPVDIVVEGNICEDHLPGIDAGATHYVIELRFGTAAPGTLAQIPGLPKPDGTVDLPSAHFGATGQGTDAAVPVVHPTGVQVRGNVYRKTVAAGDFTSYGYGPYIRRDSDDAALAVTDAMLRPVAIGVSGSARDLTIGGNDFDGVSRAIEWDLVGQPRLGVMDVRVRGNRFKDWSSEAITFLRGDKAKPQHVVIEDNDFDGDPFFAHPSRGAGGRWQDVSAGGALNLNTLSGYEIVGNRFRNVPRVFFTQPTATSTDGAIRDNVAYCDPAGDGYHADNRGIGRVPSPWGFRYVIEDSDPTSLSWRALLNPCFEEAPALPSGKWVAGVYVRSTSLTGGVLGWQRLTTGSGNVLGVDWQAVMAPRGFSIVTVTADAFNTVPTSPEGTVVLDTAALTAGRNRALGNPGAAGGLVKYLNRTTGGQTVTVKSLTNAGAILTTMVAGDYAEFAWNGSAWELLFKRAAA